MKSLLLSLCRRNAAVLILALAPFTLSAARVEVPGVGNFDKVDGVVYRGAQPTDAGFSSLSKMGIKTVVDLRLVGEHSQAEEQREVEAAGMHYISVPMHGMATPTNEDVTKVLSLLQDVAAGPVFVHCKRGADRTGAVIACYRIRHDHWENKRALEEARSFGMSWYQRALQHYVLHFPPSIP